LRPPRKFIHDKSIISSARESGDQKQVKARRVSQARSKRFELGKLTG
jgi:hypothetical protein